ncbi:zinc-binding protein A33-like isoform X1 [Tachysurus fulvidraco]|uniref:zinc-binding protein A33-like isoform X1 n=1 Tax=Tachysurus fulvidraco TaxID=1234273 RepID=UPI001FED9D6D|nr:zinc-binding protein A33-like isoform X1 [Tachysurus fulvidraco]
MISSETGERSTGAFHSLVSLRNPHKKRENKRTCKSESFHRPRMSLSMVKFVQMLLSNFIFKCVRSEQKSVNAGGLRIPKKVWENLTRPSAKVILDPNTADPTLKLSEDGRSVRTKTHKEFHSSQSIYEYHRKSAQQYNGWMCVQAKEGYSTDRHYWEVDVKGKCDWSVGVVKESAPHSGFINLNTATGYWTLRLQLGSLIALTEPITKLNQAPPAKLGVHLDVEKGQVSFYDAMRRKNIYTFNTEFRNCEKIYPVFGTVETDKPLKII